jgi:hypothetical protein
MSSDDENSLQIDEGEPEEEKPQSTRTRRSTRKGKLSFFVALKLFIRKDRKRKRFNDDEEYEEPEPEVEKRVSRRAKRATRRSSSPEEDPEDVSFTFFYKILHF